MKNLPPQASTPCAKDNASHGAAFYGGPDRNSPLLPRDSPFSPNRFPDPGFMPSPRGDGSVGVSGAGRAAAGGGKGGGGGGVGLGKRNIDYEVHLNNPQVSQYSSSINSGITGYRSK